MLDRAALDRVNNLVRNREDRISPKTARHGLSIGILWESRQFERFLDHWGEVVIFYVDHSRPADQARCEDVVLVRILGGLNAVGRHEDRARKFSELLALILPRGPIMAVKMIVLL